MLILYKARTAQAAADRVLSEIKSGTGRHVVIAPDPFTLAVEKTISQKIGKKGIFDIEVMSFARLASIVLGDKIKKCLSPAGSVMLMEKVILQNEKALLHYGHAARKSGFAAEMYAAITSVRNSGVTPEQLFDAEQKLPDGVVKGKTHDVALLYRAYLNVLAVDHTDSTTRLEALTRELQTGEEYGDVHFHVVDHVDLNAKQVEVLSVLMCRAASLSVAVTDGTGASNKRIYPHLAAKLCAIAKKQNVTVKEISVEDHLSEEKDAIACHLFSYSFSQSKSQNVFLAQAKDLTEEVTCLATVITDLVRKKGLRYCDVAVISPSFEEYLPYMERIFRRYGIPLFSDERIPLSRSDVFRHLLCAMEIPSRGFEEVTVKKYLSHALFDTVTEEEKSAFSDYVDKSGVNRFAFKEPFVLYENDPLFAPAEKVRGALMQELGDLAFLPSKGTIGAYAEVLRGFLLKNDFDQKIKTYKERVDQAGLLKHGEIVRQSPAALMTLLDTLSDLRGEEEVSCAEFLFALTTGAEQVKIAALPVRLDSVYFAPVKQAMYAPIGALFVLGAEEGLFPLETLGEGILGMREYAAWQAGGIEIKIENTGVEELSASKFHALQLLLRGERLYLSHLESKVPSSCIKQLSEIFGEGEKLLEIKNCSEILDGFAIDVRIPTVAVAESLFATFSRRAREGLLTPKEESFALVLSEVLSRPFPIRYEEETFEIHKDLFFKEKVVNVSELESYFSCPFRHFVKYGLSAKEKQVADADARDIGNLAHDCIEEFVKEHVMPREKGAIDDQQAKDIAEDIAKRIVLEPRYLAIAEKQGNKVLDREIKSCREVAVVVKNQIYASKFVPTWFEKNFSKALPVGAQVVKAIGEGDIEDRQLTSVTLNGVTLSGRMDRVDLYSDETANYAVALDYKTGSNEVEHKALFFGEKVQLPLYLAVLRASGFIPVAALYASLSDAGAPEKYLFGPKWNNEALMKALDATVSDKRRSQFTSIYFEKKSKTFKAPKDMLMSREALQAQIDYAIALSEQAIEEIKQGFIHPTPQSDGWKATCEYCKAKSICRRAGMDTRKTKAISAEFIQEVMTEDRKDDNA